MQGWFPYDKELWGPNALEQSLASGDMVRILLGKLGGRQFERDHFPRNVSMSLTAALATYAHPIK